MRFELFPKHHIRYFHAKYLLDAVSQVHGRVLDVGCGWGLVPAQLKIKRPDLEIVGCDNDAGYISLCKKRFGKTEIKWVESDAYKLTFRKNEFNAVSMMDVLEHLEKPKKAVSEITRILKKGGVFHLVLPLEGELTNLDGIVNRVFRKNLKKVPVGHQQQFTMKEIRRILKRNGFNIKRIRYSYYPFYQLFSLIYYLSLAVSRRGEYRALRSSRKSLNKILSAIIILIGWIVFLENKLMSNFKGQTAHITAVLKKKSPSPTRWSFAHPGFRRKYLQMRLNITSRLVRVTPRSFQSFLKLLGFQKIVSLLINKSEAELIFQTNWMQKFSSSKQEVLEYWRRYRYLDEIEKICNFTQDKKVLDVGCGISTVLHYIRGQKYGIDPLADEYLKMYRYPNGISVQKGVGEKIPFPDEYFNVVFCSNVLDHTEDPKQVISEIYRVLKNENHLVLVVHIFDKNFKRDPAHPHTFTKRDVFSLVKKRFQVVFEKESPAVGLYRYVVEGKRKDGNKELVMVFKKT